MSDDRREITIPIPKVKPGWPCPKCGGAGRNADGSCSISADEIKFTSASKCVLCQGEGRVHITPYSKRKEAPPPLPPHPMQPIYLDERGVARFRGNAIVERLFQERVIDLNAIAMWEIPIDDKEQFWQLIGRSVGGFREVSFVRDSTAEKAQAIADGLLKDKTR